MKIGIVTIWCNRGQGTVARHLRGILDDLGHQTRVLARPAEGKKKVILSEGVWDQPHVTHADKKQIPLQTYLKWVKEEELEVVFFDQNYQFEEIQAIRQLGVKTVGRFVWEKFRETDCEESLAAFDVIYSLTKCEKARYATMGIQSPYILWGCHPEVVSRAEPQPPVETVKFLFPASGRRKLTREALEAFHQFAPENAELYVKSNIRSLDVEIPDQFLSDRVTWVDKDLDMDEYHKLLASCHVCLCPTLWEGLGLHLYEAVSHGIPVIATDFPPVNEVVINQETGVLVPGIEIKQSRSGIPGYSCSIEDLGKAIIQLSDISTWRLFHEATLVRREQLNWRQTIEDIQGLLNAVLSDKEHSS